MAMQLVPLPAVERLSPRVVRILGANPGKFTLQGTNTYLIGLGASRVVLDTGEGKPEWLENMKSVLMHENASVQKCLLTHWHLDHVGGVSDLIEIASRTAPVHKHMPQYKGSEAWLDVHDSERFLVDANTTLRACICPGHTKDHVAYVLEEEDAMFTGDNILGQGTGVFEDLATYMSSLKKMGGEFKGRAYPGHGPVIEDGNKAIADYIAHRRQRENQIVETLRKAYEMQSGMSSMDIVKIVYKDIPSNLHLPAQGGVDQVLQKLRSEKRVVEVSADRWKLTEDSNL